MSFKLKVIASLFWKLFERGGRAVIELIVQIVLARLLAPEQFGALAIILVFINLGNVIVQSGLNTALIQTPDIDNSDYSTVFWMSLAISLVLYSLIFLAAPAIAGFYNMLDIVWPLRVLALLLIIYAFNSVQVAKVSRELVFQKLFIATIISAALSGAFGIWLAMGCAGLWALVAQQLVFQIVNCAVLSFQVRWRPALVFNKERARKLFSFGWKLLASGLLNAGYQSLSDLIIGKQFTASQLGYVLQGKRYPQALGAMLDGATQTVLLSAIAHVQNDSNYVKRIVRRAMKTSTYTIMPLMVLFALIAEPLVRVLFGEQWLPSVFFLQVYCLSYALLPIHTSNLSAINAMGRSDLFLKLELIKKSYGLLLLLVTAFVVRDVHVMVAGYLVADVISAFVNAYPNRVAIGYSYFEQARDILPAAALSAASAIVAWTPRLFGLPDVELIGAQIVVMSAAYLLLSKVFGVETFRYLVTTAKEIVSGRDNSANNDVIPNESGKPRHD